MGQNATRGCLCIIYERLKKSVKKRGLPSYEQRCEQIFPVFRFSYNKRSVAASPSGPASLHPMDRTPLCCGIPSTMAFDTEDTEGILHVGHRQRAVPLVVVTIVLASLANALNQADRNIVPIAVIPMADELGYSLMERGLVLSSFAYGYIFVQIVAGFVATRVPPLTLLLAAVFVWSFSTVATPVAAHLGLGVLFGCRVVMGLAEGFCLPAIFQHFASNVSEARRSGAFAVMLASGSVGQLLALLFCPLIPQWEWMFTSFGIAGFVWCGVYGLALLAETRVRPHQVRHVNLGASSSRDEVTTGAVDRDINATGQVVASAENNACSQTPWGRLISCRAVQAIVAAHFAQNWTNYTMSAWFPTFLHESLGVPTRQLWMTAVPFAVNAVAGTGFGLAADAALARSFCSVLTVRRAATLIGLLGPAVCLMIMTTISSSGAALALMTLSFFFGSATNSGYMANHADLSRSYAGLTFGIANTAATIPGLIAGPLTAAILGGDTGADAPWGAIFGLAAAVNVVGALVYATLAKADKLL